MKKIFRGPYTFLFLIVLCIMPSISLYAQDSTDAGSDQDAMETGSDEEVAGTDESVTESTLEVELTDEELDTLLTNVDRFFIDQDMASLTVDLDIYRDPSNVLNDRNIREGNPSALAGLCTIVSHYAYAYPDYFQLSIMGQVLAGSDAPEDRTFFSQLLPMPGSPIYTDGIKSRFMIRFESMSEVDGREVYKIRYSALDRATEFFDSIVYFIDVEREVILRVESSFDNGWYVGSGRGNYYYDEWLGKYLPIYGHGSVLFYPNRTMNVWGKWYRWNWQTPEELSLQQTSPNSPAETEQQSE